MRAGRPWAQGMIRVENRGDFYISTKAYLPTSLLLSEKVAQVLNIISQFPWQLKWFSVNVS